MRQPPAWFSALEQWHLEAMAVDVLDYHGSVTCWELWLWGFLLAASWSLLLMVKAIVRSDVHTIRKDGGPILSNGVGVSLV